MTKTAKEIIHQLIGHDDGVDIGNGYHDECKAEVDQALEELGAIIREAKPKGYSMINKNDELLMAHDTAYNTALDRYEADLIEALYGKDVM